MLGNPLHHAHDNAAPNEAGLSNVEFTLTIEGQEGRLFQQYGTQSRT